MNPTALLRELVALHAPPGQESAVREYLEARTAAMGLRSQTDAKGNLYVDLSPDPTILVTAHMDEIAMVVTNIHADGALAVRSLGGLHPWKLGEGPVRVLGLDREVTGILGFGGIHTEDPAAVAVSARHRTPAWSDARVITNLSAAELVEAGIVPGVRAVCADRDLHDVNGLIAGRFLDDRADLVAWLMALDRLRASKIPVRFAATVSEEVGGEGARYIARHMDVELCIALELGPNVPDAPVNISPEPTLWVTDSFATIAADDLARVSSLGIPIQYQALSRGGSDASCLASEGLCARHITLGIPMENSHGFEIMHPEAMVRLAGLTVELLHLND